MPVTRAKIQACMLKLHNDIQQATGDEKQRLQLLYDGFSAKLLAIITNTVANNMNYVENNNSPKQQTEEPDVDMQQDNEQRQRQLMDQAELETSPTYLLDLFEDQVVQLKKDIVSLEVPPDTTYIKTKSSTVRKFEAIVGKGVVIGQAHMAKYAHATPEERALQLRSFIEDCVVANNTSPLVSFSFFDIFTCPKNNASDIGMGCTNIAQLLVYKLVLLALRKMSSSLQDELYAPYFPVFERDTTEDNSIAIFSMDLSTLVDDLQALPGISRAFVRHAQGLLRLEFPVGNGGLDCLLFRLLPSKQSQENVKRVAIAHGMKVLTNTEKNRDIFQLAMSFDFPSHVDILHQHRLQREFANKTVRVVSCTTDEQRQMIIEEQFQKYQQQASKHQ